MTVPVSRSGRPAAASGFAAPAPHAALLIDFDNVTMGIRSDLTKELKALLSSDIIRSKVTVQRAYADWRRYPQYVMPLTERSIDMIWATAVGATKKNATDIRLAIDAIELMFTRPEIGTFIILSGDSDFSSLVLKLKEYGKYVIGIGIRESASDLLIQNCDEYYSYSELAGLNKEVGTQSAPKDPWELVREAVSLMVRNSDVMRSDRLKQVMQQIDPAFDERNAGFSRFSKFLTEAGTKGLLTLSKLDNGQFEVGLVDQPAVRRPTADAAASAPAREGGRGRGGRGRDRDRGRREPAKTAPPAEKPPAAAKPALEKAKPSGPAGLTLGEAFKLMTTALHQLPNPAQHEALRARMAALHGREDRLLEPESFDRLLRQANDAEVATVKKAGEGFEVSLTRLERARAKANGPAEPAETPAATTASAAGAADDSTDTADAGRASTLRFRRGSRSPARPAELSLVGAVDVEDVRPVASKPDPSPDPTPAPETPAAKPKKRTRKAKSTRSPKAAASTAKAAPPADAKPEPAAATEKSAAKAEADGKKAGGTKRRGRRKSASTAKATSAPKAD